MLFSGANLFAGLLFSSIGFVGFAYGKRMSLWKPMFIGLALMAYPYFIEDTIALCGIGLVGSAVLYWKRA
ncbi:MAG: amino acid transport protein [Chthoniobacterales bacterium]|nr:amino acid transport protein [Verrucomicrobiota bacterium]